MSGFSFSQCGGMEGKDRRENNDKDESVCVCACCWMSMLLSSLFAFLFAIVKMGKSNNGKWKMEQKIESQGWAKQNKTNVANTHTHTTYGTWDDRT